jgi:hypothetical protein
LVFVSSAAGLDWTGGVHDLGTNEIVSSSRVASVLHENLNDSPCAVLLTSQYRAPVRSAGRSICRRS